MANLTKEYFDKRLNGLEKGIKSHTEAEVDKLAGMVKRRFDEVERKLDVRDKVERLEAQMKQVREALSL
jgi:hypothetical protein